MLWKIAPSLNDGHESSGLRPRVVARDQNAKVSIVDESLKHQESGAILGGCVLGFASLAGERAAVPAPAVPALETALRDGAPRGAVAHFEGQSRRIPLEGPQPLERAVAGVVPSFRIRAVHETRGAPSSVR